MSQTAEGTDRQAVLRRALVELKEMRSRLAAVEQAKTEPIAIVGIGCRFPGGAVTPEGFWQLLRSGRDAIVEIPAARWNAAAYYDADPERPGKMYVRHGGFLEQADRFDASFFRILPREAVRMDPQQRLLLEVTWEALEHAGQAPDLLVGSKTGVFIGISSSEYTWLAMDSGVPADGYSAVGAALNVTAGRLSHTLGLRGPSMALDTACSSSLVAMHLGCQSLRSGESDLALAGGTNLMLSPLTYVALCRARMLAPDGRCKTFDAAADGYGRGEGVGVVVLKRLRDALRDKNPIVALIRGTAVSHDGWSSGLTVPSRQAQEGLIRAALADAGVTPDQVSYIEAHGTGTALGDPIELRALAAALGRGRATRCAVGSVKTNIGHLEAASGVAGLIKVALALRHREIPPHLHLRNPNPHLVWDELPITVPTELTPWPSDQGTRIAGVSSFGFSGIICHVVMEEAPPEPQPEQEPERPAHILCISAQREEALRELAGGLARHLDEVPGSSLAEVCHTAHVGRAHFPRRLALVAESAAAARAQLAAVAAGDEAPGVQIGEAAVGARPKVAFLFTGQGSQYVGMGRTLYETQPTFRRALERCDAILRPLLERPLLSVLYPNDDALEALHQTAYTQPALFSLQWSLAELWRSWGIEPTAVLGHSVGEYAAACIAGVFSLEDGLGLIAERARLMQALPQQGAMLAVAAGEERVAAQLAPFPQLALAAINGPESTVVSGARQELEPLHATLQAAGIKTRWLVVSHAFHSPLMDPMLDALERRAAQVALSPPRLRLISNLTGQAADRQVCDPLYWRRHAREPVRFRAGMQALRAQGIGAFIEIGPAPVLLGLGKQSAARDGDLWLPSLREGVADWLQLSKSLAALYVAGIEVDWAGFDRDCPRRRVQLPAYPFQRERYWIGTPYEGGPPLTSHTADAPPHPLLGRRLRSALAAIQFESELHAGTDAPPVFTDQQLFGVTVVSGAVILMMAQAAVVEAWQPDVALSELCVEQLEFETPLILSAEHPTTVQLILEPLSRETANFQVHSLEAGAEARQGPKWKRHATGKVRVGPQEPGAEALGPHDVAAIQAACREQVSGEAMYRGLEQGGARCMGPAFRIIEHLWRRDGEALARLSPLATTSIYAGSHRVDPALLMRHAMGIEGAGNALFEVIPPGERATSEQVYVAMGMQRFRTTGKGPLDSIRWCHAVRRRSQKEGTFIVDLYMLEPGGEVVAWAEGTRMRCIDRALLAGAVRRQARRGPAVGGSFAEALMTAEPPQRRPLLIEHLQRQFSAVSGLPIGEVSTEKSISMLGMDSLMAVEIKKLLDDELRLQIPLLELLKGPSLRQLAEQLLLLLPAPRGAEPAGASALSAAALAGEAGTVPGPIAPERQDWVTSLGADGEARLRLFCFPYGGGGASIYRTWSDGLPADVEVCPIQLPGREARIAEPPIDRLELLLAALERAIVPWLDRPFAFFGCSMGALLSFELARRLHRLRARTPMHLFVAAFSAPHLPNSIDARWSGALLDGPPAARREREAEVVQALCEQGILPQALVDNPELRDMMWPTLRADFLLVHRYRYRDGEPLTCPISAFGGVRDNDVTAATLEPWRRHTAGPFKLHMCSGGHLFLDSDRPRVLQLLSQSLRP